MRLPAPRKRIAHSSDGSVNLRFVDVDMDRERGGWVIELTSSSIGNSAVIVVTVSVETTDYAREYFLNKGIDIFDVSFIDMKRYINEYADRNGNVFIVRHIIVKSGKKDDVERIISKFKDAFFNFASSYENNCDEFDSFGSKKFYPDILKFTPAELPSSYHFISTAGKE